LQTRLSLIEKISLVESEERMQQEVFARSERLIGFQFDLESGQKRICPSMEREFAFSQPEDIWQCYKEIAEEIGCAPYLGLTL
jgi:hypothetical protein